LAVEKPGEGEGRRERREETMMMMKAERKERGKKKTKARKTSWVARARAGTAGAAEPGPDSRSGRRGSSRGPRHRLRLTAKPTYSRRERESRKEEVSNE
jgi:hypothetical protein